MVMSLFPADSMRFFTAFPCEANLRSSEVESVSASSISQLNGMTPEWLRETEGYVNECVIKRIERMSSAVRLPVWPEVRDGSVQWETVTEVGIVSVMLELVQSDAAALGPQVTAPTREERRVWERKISCIVPVLLGPLYTRDKQKRKLFIAFCIRRCHFGY